MPNPPSCFIAYPSQPASLGEAVESAFLKLDNSGVASSTPWRKLRVGGVSIWTTIASAINEADLFVCDLTYLNANVLFELGYAIARKKRVWIVLNPNVKDAESNYRNIRPLTTIGYRPYSNSDDIFNAFLSDQPQNDLENTIFEKSLGFLAGEAAGHGRLLYVKSGVDDDASRCINHSIESSSLPFAVDDPTEVRSQPLSWYGENSYQAAGAIVHLLNPSFGDAAARNSSNSFVAGLAHGFGVPLLMLAEEPFESALDYADLLLTYDTAKRCQDKVVDWLQGRRSEKSQAEESTRVRRHRKRLMLRLNTIRLGDLQAENEPEELLDYFVETAAYQEAKLNKSPIVLGRKGTGKTAIFVKVVADTKANPRNHVCEIRPEAYELKGIVQILGSSMGEAEKGFLVESLWKFLLYGELARSILAGIDEKPPYYTQSKGEADLVEFMRHHPSIADGEFSTRLDTVVDSLKGIAQTDKAVQQKLRISELLHEHVIGDLRTRLGEALSTKEKVLIAIDNLDKAWDARRDVEALSMLLLGLLNVSHRILREFSKSDYHRKAVELSVAIFLRSDIFSELVKFAREKDKLSHARIRWDDRSALRRVLEERFLASDLALSKPDDVWSTYFCAETRGVPTKDFLVDAVMPRPRDAVSFCKSAWTNAVNRGHGRIEEEDIEDAELEYSFYALQVVVGESAPQFPKIESLLYEFAGEPEIVDRRFIGAALQRCGSLAGDAQTVIDLLTDVSFLGREVAPDEFQFLYNDENRPKLLSRARKMAEGNEDAERFRVNPPFHRFLEIRPA